MGATVAIIIGAVAAAGSLAATGYSMSGAGNPSQPNLSSSSAGMSNAQAQLLAPMRQIQAEAELGGSGRIAPGYQQITISKGKAAWWRNDLEHQIAGVQAKINQATKNGGTAPDKLTSKLNQLQARYNSIPEGGGQVYVDKNHHVVAPEVAVPNFSGYGQADIQGKIMQEMAQSQLALSQKYDSQFIESALEQEKLADPQSFEGRQKLYDLIEQQIENPPDSPVSKEIQRQVSDRVAAGSGLTADEKQLLASAVASGAADRGQSAAGADFSNELTTGFQGERRAMANADAGARWLASGQTPDDIAYRAEQQDLANLGNFIGGRTPQSQFKELSGAQQGPTPVTTGGAPALGTMDPNAGQLGASAAVHGYQSQVSAALNQANPWMAGLSGVLGMANTAGAAGWKPLATQPQAQAI